MIPSRWKLRRWGKRVYLLGLGMLMLSELLERMNEIALEKARGQVEQHEFIEHTEADSE